MFARSVELQAGFAIGSSLLIVTYLTALCAAGYNERVLEAGEKTVRMLRRASRCHGAVVALSATAVLLILLGHAKIIRSCGLVQAADGDVRALIFRIGFVQRTKPMIVDFHSLSYTTSYCHPAVHGSNRSTQAR